MNIFVTLSKGHWYISIQYFRYRLRKPYKLVHNFNHTQKDDTYEWMVATIQLHKKVVTLSTYQFLIH